MHHMHNLLSQPILSMAKQQDWSKKGMGPSVQSNDRAQHPPGRDTFKQTMDLQTHLLVLHFAVVHFLCLFHHLYRHAWSL